MEYDGVAVYYDQYQHPDKAGIMEPKYYLVGAQDEEKIVELINNIQDGRS